MSWMQLFELKTKNTERRKTVENSDLRKTVLAKEWPQNNSV